jgi:hypothetical protein
MPDVQPYQHPAFPQPADPNVRLWRYIDWFKFEWLVRYSRLYMPSVNDFPDKLEGTAPQGEVDWWERSIRNAPSPEQQAIIASNQEKILRFAKMFRPHYYVCCWHMNSAENPRMWHEYTKGPPSVAIRTTLSKLRQTLRAYVEIGVVRYIDYGTDRLPEALNMFEYIMHKNAGPFAFEQELRAVALHPIEADVAAYRYFSEHFFEREEQPASKVFAPPVNLATLLDCVVLHPKSTLDHQARAAALCTEHGLPPPVRSIAAVAP